LINERKTRDMLLFSIASERQIRPAFAVGCLCFALIGCPIGIWFSKSDYLSAFITCFLPIVTIYYPIMLCMVNLTRSGKIPPVMGMYSAIFYCLQRGFTCFNGLRAIERLTAPTPLALRLNAQLQWIRRFAQAAFQRRVSPLQL